MKRRLMVAKALVHNPPILILDEPTAGVDVELRRPPGYVRRSTPGASPSAYTHYLEEAQEMCDTIAIINAVRWWPAETGAGCCAKTPTPAMWWCRRGRTEGPADAGRFARPSPAGGNAVKPPPQGASPRWSRFWPPCPRRQRRRLQRLGRDPDLEDVFAA